jgi:multicomponent Na+:H+ antiporter subunit C
MLEHIEAALQRPNYIAFVVLFLWGFYIMVAHPNLVKKLIGMYLVQTSVIFLLVTISAKTNATVPILTLEDRDAVQSARRAADKNLPTGRVWEGEAPAEPVRQEPHPPAKSQSTARPTPQINPADYANPLPHVLTLTAIVVQVATLGVSLALVTAIYRQYGSLDEDEILKRIE